MRGPGRSKHAECVKCFTDRGGRTLARAWRRPRSARDLDASGSMSERSRDPASYEPVDRDACSTEAAAMKVTRDPPASTSVLNSASAPSATPRPSTNGLPPTAALRRADPVEPEACEPFEELTRSATTILGVALAFLAVLDQPLPPGEAPGL